MIGNIDFSKGLYPVKAGSGFKMPGWYVWCGSCIKHTDGKYYLFASRWREEAGFPSGYMTESEIVLASTDSLDKPFRFEKVIFGKREGDYWDSGMAHNPMIMRYKNGYMLFYIGTKNGSYEDRSIGVAYSDNLTDGWIRPDKPIILPPNANNPTAVTSDDGSVYLAFRDGRLRVSIAKADSYDGDYNVIAEDIFPLSPIEDMFLFKNGDRYEIIAEDNRGGYTGSLGAGVHFRSLDLINWELCEPLQVYDRSVTFDDGTSLQLQRRERPFLLEADGRMYLFTTAKIGGSTRESGGITWNMVQEYKKD